MIKEEQDILDILTEHNFILRKLERNAFTNNWIVKWSSERMYYNEALKAFKEVKSFDHFETYEITTFNDPRTCYMTQQMYTLHDAKRTKVLICTNRKGLIH